jgi:hypothetical protein
LASSKSVVGKEMAELEDSYHNLLESDLPDLKNLVDELYTKHFENKNSVTLEELRFGARLARSKFIPPRRYYWPFT